MAWNGSGTFSRVVTTVSPAADGTTIDPAAQNTYTADVTAGINACIAKNGENAATGDLDLGTNKITNLDTGTLSTDATTLAQVEALVDGITSVSVNNADGSCNVSSTLLVISTDLTEAAIESVGPTGSSADNIWTALDSVGANADWVELRIRGQVNVTGTTIFGVVYARETGSSKTLSGSDDMIWYAQNTDGDNDAKQIITMSTCKVPIDSSGRFDLRWDTSATATQSIDATLVGYGWNP